MVCYLLWNLCIATVMTGCDADAQYMPGRGAQVMLRSSVTSIGTMGVLHPEVLKHFELSTPVSALILDIEPFV